jgi:hypothetical protein
MALGIIVEEEILELLYGDVWPIRLSPSWILLFACFQVHWKRTHLGVSLGLWVSFQVHFVRYQSIAIVPGFALVRDIRSKRSSTVVWTTRSIEA